MVAVAPRTPIHRRMFRWPPISSPLQNLKPRPPSPHKRNMEAASEGHSSKGADPAGGSTAKRRGTPSTTLSRSSTATGKVSLSGRGGDSRRMSRTKSVASSSSAVSAKARGASSGVPPRRPSGASGSAASKTSNAHAAQARLLSGILGKHESSASLLPTGSATGRRPSGARRVGSLSSVKSKLSLKSNGSGQETSRQQLRGVSTRIRLSDQGGTRRTGTKQSSAGGQVLHGSGASSRAALKHAASTGQLKSGRGSLRGGTRRSTGTAAAVGLSTVPETDTGAGGKHRSNGGLRVASGPRPAAAAGVPTRPSNTDIRRLSAADASRPGVSNSGQSRPMAGPSGSGSRAG